MSIIMIQQENLKIVVNNFCNLQISKYISIPYKSLHDFLRKYPNVCVGTLLVSMRITDILSKNSSFFSNAAF